MLSAYVFVIVYVGVGEEAFSKLLKILLAGSEEEFDNLMKEFVEKRQELGYHIVAEGREC